MTKTRILNFRPLLIMAVALLAAAAVWAGTSLAGGSASGPASSNPAPAQSDGGVSFVQDDEDCPDSDDGAEASV